VRRSKKSGHGFAGRSNLAQLTDVGFKWMHYCRWFLYHASTQKKNPRANQFSLTLSR